MKDSVILGISLIGPVVGSALGVWLPAAETVLSGLLCFAAGTMLGISFLEMIPASSVLCGASGTIAGLAAGLCAMLLIEDICGSAAGTGKKKTAVVLLAAMFLHNFPEGVALAAGNRLPGEGHGLLIALSVALHDIPEGICSSGPYYQADGGRLKAFLLSLSTVVPVLCGYFCGKSLFRSLPLYPAAMMTAATAGLMIAVSGTELLPAAEPERHPRLCAVSLMGGLMLVLYLQVLIG